MAFLFDPTRVKNDELDTLISNSQKAWGGRFFPLIPTDGNTISPQWWALLEMVDPDYIHSLVTLSESLIARINRKILPVRISEVSESRNSVLPNVDALDVGGIPQFAAATRGPWLDNFFAYFKESHPYSEHHSFFLRNFGVLPGTIGVESLFRNVPHTVIEEQSLTPEALFSQLLSEKKRLTPIFPVELSRMFASPKFAPGNATFGKGLHIVIGDDPLDVAYAWNRVFLADSWHAPDVYWLPASSLENNELIAVLNQWIARTFWHGNDRFGKIVSYSIAKEDLIPIAEKLKNGACWSYEIHKLEADNFPIADWHPAGGMYSESSFNLSRNELVAVSADGGQVPFASPPFIRERQYKGGWMVDLEIQYHPESYDWTNVRPCWRLPKRVGVSGLLVTRYRDSRVGTRCSVSAAVKPTEDAIKIEIPTDRTVLHCSLFPLYGNTEPRRQMPQSRFQKIQTSSVGRSLRGLIQLFGNTWSAGRIFEETFWRNTILEMAGRPEDDFEQRTKRVLPPLKQLLEELEQQGSPLTSKHEDLEKITGRLVNSLTLFESEQKQLAKGSLVERFQKLRSEMLRRKIDEDWCNAYPDAEEYLGDDLAWLLERGVFHHGCLLQCETCGSRRWYPVDDLKRYVRCMACLNEFAFPAAPEWSYNLNSLVGNAIRKQGMLAVLLALYSVVREFPSLIFLPCQDLFETDKTEQFTDLDLVFAKDGRLILGEVKSSPDGFQKTDFDSLEIVAKELLPDEFWIVAVGTKWPNEVKVKIDHLSKQLEPLDVQVVPRLLLW